MKFLRLKDNIQGHALVELSAVIPFFLTLIFICIEFTSYYKETQNISFFTRELANGGLRFCSEEPEKYCFNRGNVLPLYSKQEKIGDKASQELEALSGGTNWPYVLITVWWNSPSGPRYAYLPIYVEGRCPPYEKNNLDAEGTRCRGEYIPYPKFGNQSPLLIGNQSIDLNAKFYDLVQSRDYIITAEAHMWHRPVTPLGKAVYSETERDSSQLRIGPSSYMYRPIIF